MGVAYGPYTACSASPTQNTESFSKESTDSGDTSESWAWAAMTWNDNNVRYAEMRQQIEQELDAGQNPQIVIDEYKRNSSSDPKNPLYAFAYCYASWFASTNRIAPLPYGPDVLDRLCSVNFPNTFDFARLRFLIQLKIHYSSQLIAVGARLTKLDPQDKHVLANYIDALWYSRTDENTSLALKYLQSMIDSYPNDPVPYAQRGFVYCDLYSRFKIPSYRQLALADLQRYMTVAPQKYAARPTMAQVIQQLQGE